MQKERLGNTNKHQLSGIWLVENRKSGEKKRGYFVSAMRWERERRLRKIDVDFFLGYLKVFFKHL